METQTAGQQSAISGKYLFEPGDVVYSKIRPTLRKAFIAPFEGLCSADMYALGPRPELLRPRYLLAILLGADFTSFAESRCTRTGIPKINRAELSEYTLRVPSIDIQDAVCRRLDHMDSALSMVREHTARLREVQSSMLTLSGGSR